MTHTADATPAAEAMFAADKASGCYDVSVPRGDGVIAEFRGRSRTIGSTSASMTSKESR
ncbi:hypothetical protein OG542_37625 [Streptomyces violaceus]|uniref:hypothetical protein n=1 Tax=Streptomyces violaceus TaxID=1936 RepID=UPI002E20491C